MKPLLNCLFFVLLAGGPWGCTSPGGIPLTRDKIKFKQFRVDGHRIHINNYIDRETPDLLRKILQANPQVSTVLMHNVPGSLDDSATLEAGNLVRRYRLATHLPAGAAIVSGAVDLFLAGVKRTGVIGAKLGVHSWRNDDGIQGGDLPRGHKHHQPFLDYFRKIHVAEEFYWFTLEAAPFERIHWMNRRELERYRVFTQPMIEAAK